MSRPEFSPDTDKTKVSMTAMFMKNAAITGYALEVQKFQISPLPRESAWYKNYKDALVTAQDHATSWVSDLSPRMFAEIPQSIIDYGNLFSAATGEARRILNDVLARKDTKVSASEREALLAIFGTMHSELGGKQVAIAALKAELTKFSKNLGGDRKAMTTAHAAAVKETGVNIAEMDAINRAMDSLKAEIGAANTKQAVSAIGLGVSLFVLVAAIGFAFATGGAAAPLVVGAIAIVGVAAGTVGLVVYTKEINDKIRELNKKFSELSDEQKQVTALGLVASSLKSLEEHCGKAIDALADTVKMWSTLEGKLKSVVTGIEKADASDVEATISLYMNTSCAAWQQLTEYATLLQYCAVDPEVKVTAHETAAAA